MRVASVLAPSDAHLEAVEHLMMQRADAALLVSSTGAIVAASAAGERALRRGPELQALVAHAARARATKVRRVSRPALRVELTVTPCTPRGASAARLVVIDDAPAHHGTRGRLSSRQAELLELLEHGFTNAEIAARMGLAPTTVKTMLQRLYKLAGASGRVELLRWRRRL